MNELKPCPFCGGEAKIVNNKELIGGNIDEFKIVANHNESCIMFNMFWQFFYETKEEAIKAWNRRVDDDIRTDT